MKPSRNVGVIICSTMSSGTIQPTRSRTAPATIRLRGLFSMLLTIQPAGHQMLLAPLEVRRLLYVAHALDGHGAARVETAACRRIHQAGRLAARHFPEAVHVVGIRVGNGVHQSLRVRVARI